MRMASRTAPRASLSVDLAVSTLSRSRAVAGVCQYLPDFCRRTQEFIPIAKIVQKPQALSAEARGPPSVPVLACRLDSRLRQRNGPAGAFGHPDILCKVGLVSRNEDGVA